MIEKSTISDIERISYDILKQSKALDVFPTPVDEIVSFSDLIVNKELNLSHIDESFLSKMSGRFKDIMQHVRGILDRREKIIYLDLSQSSNRQNFVKLHETGHNVLDWQQAILEFMDDDETLDPFTNKQFEAEANYFASATLFQLDRFDHEVGKLELGLKTVMHLSKHFGASVHATYRRYVERSKKRCCLLVLENITDIGEFPICSVRNYFQSPSFTAEFGEISWENELGYTWSFVKDYYHGRKFLIDREISITTNDGDIDCTYHFFNSTYNAFVFLFPKGEKIKTRTKFVIQGA